MKFKNIELVDGICEDCIFSSFDECDFVELIVETPCGANTCFKYTETWEPCTKDNIRVGSTVRSLWDKSLRKVTYIFQNKEVIITKYIDSEDAYHIEQFEVLLTS